MSLLNALIDLLEIEIFTRKERIGLWLLTGFSAGCWKAGNWMQEGVHTDVALFFGAAFAIDVLMIVSLLHIMLSTIPLWRRLRKRQ